MERLTNKKEADTQRKRYKIRMEQGYPRNIPEERFLRLAAYEDTGLEPEEISALCEMDRRAKMAEMLRIEESAGVSIDRLAELAQADRDGRCVVLPAGGFSDQDGENALKSAMNTCYYHNNPVTRFIADAVAEKLVRAEAALKEKENNSEIIGGHANEHQNSPGR